MLRVLFLIFVVIPILEIYLFIHVGSQIGTVNTIITAIATAVIGIILVRKEGIRTLISLDRKLDHGELPAKEMVDGVILVVAGILLIVPGFFSDGVGFLLVFPWTREIFRLVLLVIVAKKAHAIMKKMANDDPNFFVTQAIGKPGSFVVIPSRTVLPAPRQPQSAVEPVVPIEQAVEYDFVVCLICGKAGKLLKRHIKSAHNLNAEEYRHRFNLPKDFPLVAPSYSEKRRNLALDAGLGKKLSGFRKKRTKI